MLDLSRLTFINEVEDVPKNKQFEIIKDFKLNARAKILCGTASENNCTYFLKNFVNAVYKMSYTEKPNYGKLR